MRRYSWSGYSALLRKRHKLKKHGKAKSRTYLQLGKKSSAYRKRMINSRNKAESFRRKTPAQCAKMSKESKKLYDNLKKRSDGKKVDALWKNFHMLNCSPPSITTLPNGRKEVIPLMQMGTTAAVFISNKNKGEHGKRTKTIKGEWIGATEQNGKHVLLLTRRPISGKFKFVGYAPRTDYILPKDVEALESPKSGYHWKHVHGEKDGKEVPRNELEWPKVYADRNGKVDGQSNFIYDKTRHGKITNWMYG